MAKIKVTEKAHEIEGSLKKGNVRPSGNSAHIPFSKEHMGKVVDVIIPNEPSYVWVFDETLRNTIVTMAIKKTKNYPKDRKYFLDCIKEFSEKEFSLNSIMKTIYLIEDEPALKKEISLIKSAYRFP